MAANVEEKELTGMDSNENYAFGVKCILDITIDQSRCSRSPDFFSLCSAMCPKRGGKKQHFRRLQRLE